MENIFYRNCLYVNIFSCIYVLFHRDGLISKEEMMAYFLRAKSQFHCKMGPGFIHNFQEMTYLKPTFCEHCAGFVRSSYSIIYIRQ